MSKSGEAKTIRDPNIDLEAYLLDAVTAAGNGYWVNIKGLEKISIHIVIVNATVTLHGSNEEAPANSADGVNLVTAGLVDNMATSATITASTIALIKCPLKWIKCKPTTVTGSVSAYLVAV